MKEIIFWDGVFNDFARDIEGKTVAAKINEEVISFPPLHVYSHPRKEFP